MGPFLLLPSLEHSSSRAGSSSAQSQSRQGASSGRRETQLYDFPVGVEGRHALQGFWRKESEAALQFPDQDGTSLLESLLASLLLPLLGPFHDAFGQHRLDLL